jgi:alcohol dehydrogenase
VQTISFQTVPQLLIECGVQQRLGALLAGRFKGRRLVVVTDQGLHRSGLLKTALESLRGAGFQTLVIDDVVGDPPDHVVLAAARRAREFGAEVVLGLGGGSSMDVAKLVAVLTPGTQSLPEMYGVDRVHGERLPLVQMPTTAGTGSEVTPIAIVTTGQTTKTGIVSRQLMADMAILDATLTTGLPRHITAATGIDAMVHAIEAYTSARLKNPLSDLLAREALRLLSSNLLQACGDGQDLAAREAMLLGAMLAGQGFANAPVGAVHALAYPLGARFHLPHGLSNALVLAPVLRFNSAVASPAYAELANILVPDAQGDASTRARIFINAIEARVSATGLPLRLRDHGILESDLPQLASDAMQQTRLLINNPRPLKEGDALSIYQQAF